MAKDEFYNLEVKEEYLNSFPSDTKTTYSSVFRKTSEHEEFVEKDLYDFSLLQLERLMEILKLKTLNGAKTYGRIISSYLNWAIEKGLRTDPNPLKNVGNEWFEKFVTTVKMYLTEEDVIEIEDNLVNYQDKVIIRLLFEGINGFQHSEILNLKVTDLKGNTLILNDDKYSQRQVNVTERAANFIERAAKEYQYLNKNGDTTGKRSVSPLVENDYVLKSTMSRSTINTGSANKHLIYRRISSISEYFDLPYLTPKNIEKSGRIKMGRDLLLSDGVLEKDQLDKIIKRYGISSTIVNGKEYHVYSSLTEYVNKETIESLY